MRAEDLFEAMGALDEQLIALSEEDGRRAREAESQRARNEENRKIGKRRKRAEIYRFAAIAMTTAAAVFVVLTAKDLLNTRSRSYAPTAAESAEYSMDESAAMEAAEDTLATGAAEIEAREAAAEPGAGAAAETGVAMDADSEDKTAQAKTMAGDQGPAEEAAESEVQKEERNELAEAPEAQSANEAMAPDAVSDAEEAAPVMDEAAEAEAQDSGKTAVDLLGDLKGDYVKLEIISAEDRASGGERRIPEYTKEREEALTAALEEGKKMPTMFVRIGAPIYYVYLTDSTGKVDTVTFYENGYVGIDTIPSFVMKISDESFDAVKEMFN